MLFLHYQQGVGGVQLRKIFTCALRVVYPCFPNPHPPTHPQTYFFPLRGYLFPSVYMFCKRPAHRTPPPVSETVPSLSNTPHLSQMDILGVRSCPIDRWRKTFIEDDITYKINRTPCDHLSPWLDLEILQSVSPSVNRTRPDSRNVHPTQMGCTKHVWWLHHALMPSCTLWQL